MAGVNRAAGADRRGGHRGPGGARVAARGTDAAHPARGAGGVRRGGSAHGRAAPGAPVDHRRGAGRDLLRAAARRRSTPTCSSTRWCRPRRRTTLAEDDARRELTRRFISGHGPASERDLARWSTLTLSADPQRPGRPHRGARAGGGRRAQAVVRPPGAGSHHARARGLPAADLRRGVPDLRRRPASRGATPTPPGNGCSRRPAAASSSSRARTSASGSGWCRPRTYGSPCGPTCRWAATTDATGTPHRPGDFSSGRWTGSLRRAPAYRRATPSTCAELPDGHSTKGAAPLHGGDALRRSESGRGTQDGGTGADPLRTCAGRAVRTAG